MDYAARLEEVAVAGHEQRSGKTLLLAADLRVSKSDPYLRDLTGSEERLYELDAGAEECYIIKRMLLSIFGTFPKTGPLDVHAYIIARRIALGQVYGVVAFATAEFQNYRIVVSEEVPAPSALERVVTVQDFRCSRLDHTSEGLVLLEFAKLVLSHDYSAGLS